MDRVRTARNINVPEGIPEPGRISGGSVGEADRQGGLASHWFGREVCDKPLFRFPVHSNVPDLLRGGGGHLTMLYPDNTQAHGIGAGIPVGMDRVPAARGIPVTELVVPPERFPGRSIGEPDRQGCISCAGFGSEIRIKIGGRIQEILVNRRDKRIIIGIFRDHIVRSKSYTAPVPFGPVVPVPVIAEEILQSGKYDKLDEFLLAAKTDEFDYQKLVEIQRRFHSEFHKAPRRIMRKIRREGPLKVIKQGFKLLRSS